VRSTGPSSLQALAAAFEAEGLHIALPVGQAAMDQAGVGVRLEDLLPGAAGGVVVADGGGRFFARFRSHGDVAGPDPLDRYTAAVIARAVETALAGTGVRHVVVHPFSRERPIIPFQRLGRAAGLPRPGPLGIQVHPVYGPWWAYRAFVVLDVALPASGRLADRCDGCPAPCAAACPGRAVRAAGFDVSACVARREADEGCRLSCAARLACVAGPEHSYPREQLAFHMGASLARLRAR
jgi:ferredoxin